MIAEADDRLSKWASALLLGIEVSFEPPGVKPDGKGVSLYLYEVRPQPPPRSRMPPLQTSLRYLVTTWAPTQQEAHDLLSELLFAAMEDEELDIEPDPLPADVWTLFGTAPRPSLVLTVQLRRDRQEQAAKLVRQRLTVQTATLMPLRGVVLGPGDVPIAGARVEIPANNLAVATDRLGRFAFAAVAAGSYPPTLRVLAKGRELRLTADAASEEPLVIHFEPLEG